MNNKVSKIRGLYAIADSKWNPCGSMLVLVEKFLKGGCKIVQLRMKDAPKGEVLENALDVCKLKDEHDFTFIINDHADVAMEVGADGVHVGENDEPVSKIKEKCGEGFIIGHSSHSVDEAVEAAKDGADYVAFGAIFQTRTKGPGHPVQGVEKLKSLVQAVDKPVVAIGGIDRTNIRDVLKTGVSSVAMISALSQSDNVETEVGYFQQIIGRIKNEELRIKS